MYCYNYEINLYSSVFISELVHLLSIFMVVLQILFGFLCCFEFRNYFHLFIIIYYNYKNAVAFIMKFAWWWPCVCLVSACPWCYHFITPVPASICIPSPSPSPPSPSVSCPDHIDAGWSSPGSCYQHCISVNSQHYDMAWVDTDAGLLPCPVHSAGKYFICLLCYSHLDSWQHLNSFQENS